MFFSSDHHFFHKNIRAFCPNTRLGSNTEEMNELLIKAHNAKVGQNDSVYFLGDFSFGTSDQTKDVVQRLNGKKTLILGNHDKVIINNLKIQSLFQEVCYYKEVKYDKKKFILFHYPMIEWNGAHRGTIHLYGHVHGKFDSIPNGKSMDVGIDTRIQCDMAPYHVDEIILLMENRENLKHHD
jgi:calcineurin-like phosphoesterase family protein